MLVTPKPAPELPGFAEEVRELNLFRQFCVYHHEGEIAAKLFVPGSTLIGETWPDVWPPSDDPNNVVLAISAMRDCKLEHPDKRFFVINTNHEEYVKLEIFPMAHPVTAAAEGKPVLADPPPADDGRLSSGGNASIYGTDIERAIRFYTETLGLELRVRVGSEWAELDAGAGLILGLHLARPPDTVPAGTRGAINIELAAKGPLDDVVAELSRRDASFKGGILSYPAVRLATMLDPDHNEIVLAQVLDAGAGAAHAS